MSGYKAFALFYDILTREIQYDKMAGYLDRIITEIGQKTGELLCGGEKGIMLDLACGTGSLTEEFLALGYDVIGIDSSADMLSVAHQKSAERNIDSQEDSSNERNIAYICQDMRNLDLYGTVDYAVCSLDSINHLITVDDVQKAMNRVSLFLNPGGVFIFDVNTVFKHQSILGGNSFVYDFDDVFCVWQNTLREDNIVEIELDIFEKSEKNYIRHTEKFSERAYTLEQLTDIILKSGLKLNIIYDGDALDELKQPSEDSQRLVFVCVK